jgi:hypothetical protein
VSAPHSYRDRLNRIVHEHSSDPMSASQAEAVYTLAWDMAIKLDAAPQVPDTARTGDRPESTTPAAAAPGVRPESDEAKKVVEDAARYRWLKKNATDIQWPEHHVRPVTMHCLDAAIDVSARDGSDATPTPGATDK